MQIRVLSVSDRIEELIYSPNIRNRFTDVEFVISCGDLPHFYVEYIVSTLDKPVFYVRGNHTKKLEYAESGPRAAPLGAIDLHRRVYDHAGVLLAGVEGSIRYKPGPYQYTQQQMWFHVFSLIPGMISNRIRTGRFLDIFVTHASPWGINDADDWPHQGIKAFRWLIEVFSPRYHLHGHIHLYGPDAERIVKHRNTEVINTYGYRNNLFFLPSYRKNYRGV
jgi:Icc-related predicted phosphoesterase